VPKALNEINILGRVHYVHEYKLSPMSTLSPFGGTYLILIGKSLIIVAFIPTEALLVDAKVKVVDNLGDLLHVVLQMVICNSYLVVRAIASTYPIPCGRRPCRTCVR
jgi:hypothetical protein